MQCLCMVVQDAMFWWVTRWHLIEALSELSPKVLFRAHHSSPCWLPLSGGCIGVNPLPSVFILLSYSVGRHTIEFCKCRLSSTAITESFSKQYCYKAVFLPCRELEAFRLLLTCFAYRPCHLQRWRKIGLNSKPQQGKHGFSFQTENMPVDMFLLHKNPM